MIVRGYIGSTWRNVAAVSARHGNGGTPVDAPLAISVR